MKPYEKRKIDADLLEDIHDSMVCFLEQIDNVPELPKYISKDLLSVIKNYDKVANNIVNRMVLDEKKEYFIIK